MSIIKTSIVDVQLNNCIMNASGVKCTTQEELMELTLNKYTGATVSKSCT